MAHTSKSTWRHQARHLAATLLLATLAAAPTLSQAGLREGHAAYDQADYAVALKELTPLAEKGHATAQSLLGKMNSLGQGMPQNKKEAARWFHLAAAQGLAEAQSVLGYLCLVGEGVQQNNELALEWTRKAAAQGEANAQFNLSVMHGEAHGIRKDPAESLKWLRQAAEKGHGAALNTLGHLYEQGQGGVRRAPASAWFLIAASAEKGHQAASKQLNKLEGQLSASDMRTGRDLLGKWRKGARLSSLI